jgi:shikimate dehydrogenase
MRKYGLIGKKLGHSFSPNYFKEKFNELKIQDAEYKAYEMDDISGVDKLFKIPIDGFNITIPFKQDIISYIDLLTPDAEDMGAVNCVKRDGAIYTGHNTDWRGFTESIKPLIDFSLENKALVLGDGGASKAVEYALKKMDIPYILVSRKLHNTQYNELDEDTLKAHNIIINTTPLGMYPHVDGCPPIPYEYITDLHILYDLVYNPSETLFMNKGKARGAKTKNGHDMLIIQAELSWKIWNS